MDIVTGNPTVIKMVIHYTRYNFISLQSTYYMCMYHDACIQLCAICFRGERDHNVLRDLLGPLVKEVLAAKDLMLVTSPVDVYRAWINQMESETGEAT